MILKSSFIIALVVLTTVIHATPIPPPPLGRVLTPENGVAIIGWENDVQADVVGVRLDRAPDDCPQPLLAAIDSPDDPQAIVQVPLGPPFEPRCLLRPGDRVYLLRYRAGRFTDEIGPYVVPARMWLPIVMR